MKPYTAISEISDILRKLPAYTQEKGMEIRVLMPKFGTINERRHRLHEVVRLSGMNIIVDDDDYPLIIKVASLPGARMQVYFLDNVEFFKRKYIFDDENGSLFKDNPDRMVFFCKGAIETVKKFGWAPDIVHCHGWMTSLIPLYLKSAYKNEPIFQNSKVVYSLYEETPEKEFPEDFLLKASINNIEQESLIPFKNGTGITLHKGAISYADAVIIGDNKVDEGLTENAEKEGKPLLGYQEEEDRLDSYMEFYQNILSE